MKKILIALFFTTAISSVAHSQLEVVKMIGKNSEQSPVGYGLFANYDFPLNEVGNQSLALELLDFVYFPGKTQPYTDVKTSRAYLSIKLGFRKIFSEENKTGFYIEPQLGYCRVVVAKDYEPKATYGDGFAAALEGGYSLEVGQRGNTFLFGLKYEADMAGSNYTIQGVGFRVSYSYSLFRRG